MSCDHETVHITGFYWNFLATPNTYCMFKMQTFSLINVHISRLPWLFGRLFCGITECVYSLKSNESIVMTETIVANANIILTTNKDKASNCFKIAILGRTTVGKN